MIDWKRTLTATVASIALSAPALAANNASEGASGSSSSSAAPSITFEQADSDKSGGLDGNELASALFTSVDTDGSATLEEQEYAHENPMFGEVDLSSYDANGDGGVDRDEFEKSYLEAATFKNSDKDGNGMVSSDEYMAMYTGY
ncbi:hypothetical protein [Aurantimonas sp. VKM B-3413]|uniref:hypothetical protein n=1 Tax=Aurantimonas sp. VKM B-3413 TaxID=2779401 RepID=UPI001E42777D|nr:hypothetical protein [Aurantimonas sp. VKM B-3413]MCB8835835.1 hypothetical protein [Aurantimonas sp. VKM B-3413]